MAANAIKALIEEGVRLLSAQSEQPKLEAEILLSHVTGKSRTHFRAFAESEVTAAEALLYRRLIEQRQSGQPIAYLTGTREFWSLNFEVTSDVLIPRPETELLCDRLLYIVQSVFRLAKGNITVKSFILQTFQFIFSLTHYMSYTLSRS